MIARAVIHIEYEYPMYNKSVFIHNSMEKWGSSYSRTKKRHFSVSVRNITRCCWTEFKINCGLIPPHLRLFSYEMTGTLFLKYSPWCNVKIANSKELRINRSSFTTSPLIKGIREIKFLVRRDFKASPACTEYFRRPYKHFLRSWPYLQYPTDTVLPVLRIIRSDQHLFI